MAGMRKYQVRHDIMTSIEEADLTLLKTLGIQVSDALRIGYIVMIQSLIAKKDDRINKQVLEQFIEIQQRDIEGIRAYIRIQDAAQMRLENLAAAEKDVSAEKEMIEVYDPDEERKVQMTRKMARRLGLV